MKVDISKCKKLDNGYFIADNNKITISKLDKNISIILDALSRLVIKYGNFSNCLVDETGNVIISSIYATCIKLLGKPLYFKIIDNENKGFALDAFSRDYGVFDYERTPKNTYAQTYAQKNRLRGSKGGKSTLYETMVLPFINNNKNLRILDFGSGKGDYCKMLKKQGFKIKEIEFFRRFKGVNSIDVKSVKRMLSEVIKDVEANGLFDIVVCDSVLNSVDTLKSEKAVIKTLHQFCKITGVIFFSGRKRSAIKNNQTKKTDNLNYIYFLDKNGFSGNFRDGVWFYQKFHSEKEVYNLIKNNVNEVCKYVGNKSSTSWQSSIHKTHHIDCIDALQHEFSLPLPNGERYKLYYDNIDFFKKLSNGNYK